MKSLSQNQTDDIIFFIIDKFKDINPNINEDQLYNQISEDYFPPFIDDISKLIK